MAKGGKLVLVILGISFIIVIALVIYWVVSTSHESFTTNSITHIGGLEDYNQLYNANPPEGGLYTSFSEGYSGGEVNTINRLDRMDKKLIPTVVSDVTPYDVDVADPQFYIYQVQAPRVIKKDPQAMQADPVRGDIPIRMYPDIPTVDFSQYGRDSLRLDGTFTEALTGLYNKYTGGSHFNFPQHTSLGATITS